MNASPIRLFQTLLHLAVLGTLGWAVIGSLIGLIGAGIGLLFVLGVGLILLVGVVYALFGIGWFETARMSGLYKLDVPAPTFAKRKQATFGGWLRSIGSQLADTRMWWALASFGLASLLGGLLIPVMQTAIWSIALVASPSANAHAPLLDWALPLARLSEAETRLVGIAGIVLALAVAVGLALLHRVFGLALIGSQAKEAALTAQARQASAQAEESAAQRAGAVRAADVERTRIERDLHDGVQPRLVSVGMTLGLAQQTIDSDPDAAKALIAEAHTSTKAAITELRQLARGIHASVLEDRGLDAALSALASRSHIPVLLDVRMDGGQSTTDGSTPSNATGTGSRAAESAIYFVIAECLTNAAKHSRASECRVTVRLRSDAAHGSVIWARIEDNGIGGAEVQPGGGLDGISNRVRAAGGTTRIDSPAGGPTAVEVSVPCAS